MNEKTETRELQPVHLCRHTKFRSNANINVARASDDGPAEALQANVSIWCVDCGHFFDIASASPYTRGVMLDLELPEQPNLKFEGPEPRVEQ